MSEASSIKVGMLVSNLEGARLGRVVAREAGLFRLEQPSATTPERFVVLDEDVLEVRGADVRLRGGPGALIPEREFEARRVATGEVRPRLGEGWAQGTALLPIPEQSVTVGMPVRDVEGRVLGKVQLAGESYFELLSALDQEHYAIDVGDVLNVVKGEVIVRNGAGVLKPRRSLEDEETRTEDLGR
jgi:hypothetical protein